MDRRRDRRRRVRSTLAVLAWIVCAVATSGGLAQGMLQGEVRIGIVGMRVDVRTRAEWSFVGVPDLSAAGKEPVLMEWQLFPTMSLNPGFAADLSSALGQARKNAPVLFLCRSGARSRAAAIAMTGVGFSRCFNILGGFEGDLDGMKHRGRQNGWKAADLPWVQS